MKVWVYKHDYDDYVFYRLKEEDEQDFSDTFEINDCVFQAFQDAKNVFHALERVVIEAARDQGVIR